MLNVLEFKIAMLRKGMTQRDVAKHLGLTPKTVSERLKNRRFGSDEIEKLIPLLDIKDPMSVFFADEVTSDATKEV